MNVVEITDPQASQMDVYARLTEAQLRSRRRPEDGLFIAESAVVIGHALDAGYQPVSLLMERRQLEGKDRPLAQRVGDVPIYVGEREVLSGITGYALTRGVLCAMRRPAAKSVGDVVSGAARVVVIDGVVDTTNIGAIFRSAAALGIDAVLLSSTSCDPFNRRAVRVSMGSVFLVPWTFLPDGADASYLCRFGFKTVAMALRNDSVRLDDPVLSAEPRLAIVLGTEGDGLADNVISDSDYTVKIPMFHGVDSLNVAVLHHNALFESAAL